jgi:AcrR family transcriptional regulator
VPKILSEAAVESFRDRLCHIAEGLFAAHGPDGVTMRELAQALGVSQMTPYRYFKDKDEILAAVRSRAFNRFAAAMEIADGQSSAKRSTKSKNKKPGLGAPENAYLNFALDNPAAYRLMFDVSQPTFANYPNLVKAMERARLTMGDGLRRLAGQGRFKGNVPLIAHVFWSALHGAVMLQLVGLLEHSSLDARKIANTALQALAKQFGIA